MKLVALSGERRETVEVRRLADGGHGATSTDSRTSTFEVRIGERTYRVEAAELGAGMRSLRVDGAQHEVAVHPAPAAVGRGAAGSGRYRVALSAVLPPREVEVVDPLTDLAQRSRGAGAGAGKRQVVALMPGRVVAVLAAEGTAVEAGAGVVVIEAMKMENEIAAEGAGTVRKVFVAPGQTVEAGEPLFEVG